jgi:DNA polymerase-3 subunit delta
MIIIKEAQMADKKIWDKFNDYFACPNPQCVVVICSKSATFALKTKNIIAKVGSIFTSQLLKDYQVPKWIEDYVKQQNLGLEVGAAAIIAEFLGNNLQKIANEISKLCLNLKEKIIKIEDVKRHISVSKDYNVFELQEALGKRNIAKVNQIINNFASNEKENPIQMVLPNLFSYFVKVIIVAQLQDKRAENIAKNVGGSPYFASQYLAPVGIYGMEKLFSIISTIRQYDLKSKGVSSSPGATSGDLLKELVFKIMY